MNFEPDAIEKYIAQLLSKAVTKNEVKRRLSSVDKYVRWAYEKGYVGEKEFEQMTAAIANAVNDPKLNSRHSSYPTPIKPSELNLDIRHYVGFAVLFLLLAFMGAGLYNQIFKKATTPFAYTTPLSAGKRVISFQGRLTDSIGNPIIAPIDITYNFYTVSSGGSSIAGSTRVCTASPDQDGVFSTLIGSDPGPSCTPELPSTIFTDNAQVWLGVKVGSEISEMSPRQQIANVGYAINAETLQGLPPGTSAGSVPFISSTGDMLVAASTPAIRSTWTSANFVISSAKTTTIQSANGGDIVLSATDGGTLRFNTFNGTLNERMTITPQGNVGINNVNPRAALDFIGNASGSGNLVFNGVTTQIAQLNGGNLNFSTSVGGDVGLATKMTLSNSGNLGIGSTAPGYRLDVQGWASASGNLTAGGQVQLGRFTADPLAVGPGSLYFNTLSNSVLVYNGSSWAAIGTGGGGGGGYWNRALDGVLIPQIASDAINLGNSATASATVHLAGKAGDNSFINTGNFGIGTTSPTQAPLTVNGNIAALAQSSLLLYDTDNSNYSGFKANGVTTANSVYTLPAAYAGGSGYYLTGDGSGNLSWTAPSSVGILWNNLQNPTGNLSLTMGTNTTGFNWATGTGANNLFSFTTDASANGTGYLVNVATGTSATVKPLRVAAGSTEALMVDATGNVGIGITSPTVKLDVNGSASVSGNLTVGFNSALRSQYGPLNLAYKNGLNSWANGLTLMDTTGNIGIGSSAPVEKLDVSGNATISGNLTIAQGNLIRPSYGPLSLAYKSGANSWATGLTLQDTTGNVGIGTTGPSAPLDVFNTVTPQLRLSYSPTVYSTIGTDSGGNLNLTTPNGSTAGIDIIAGMNAGNGTTEALTLKTNQTLGATDEVLQVLNNASALLTVLGNGNVGIGSSAPVEKLDVSGNATISGNLTIAQGNMFRASYGPTTLGYKSGVNSWSAGLSVMDTTGNIGIGTTAAAAFKTQVAGDVGPNADNTYSLGSNSLRWNTIYVNNIVGSGALGYWARGTGILYPVTTTDGLAATSSATTVATFTATGTNSALRAGGSTNYATIDASGNLSFTNSGTATITGPTTGLGIDLSGAGTVSLGNANATTVNIGNNNTATTLAMGNGTGGNTITLGNGANGTAQTISIANGASGANSTVNILSGVGTAGAGALYMADNTRVSTIDLGNIAPAAARTITVAGGNQAQNDTFNLMAGAPSAGTQTVNILTGNASGGTQALNMGTGNRALTIALGTGTGGNTINVGTGANSAAQNINIATGNAAADSNVNILGGVPTAGIQTMNVFNGVLTAGTETFNLFNGNSSSGGTQTVNIMSGTAGTSTQNLNLGTGADAITIGSTANATTIVRGNASSLIDFGNFDVATSGNITVAAGQGLDTNAAGTLALGNTTATTVNIGNTAATTIGIGTGGNLARAITIGNGTGVDTIAIGGGGTAGDAITIGDTMAATTTILRGGTNSLIDFVNFDAAANGQITSTYANSAALNLTGNGSGITFGGSGTNQIVTASGNSLALMPGGTGNVGIGSTAPGEKLDVAGNATISGNLTIAANNMLRSATGPLNLGYKNNLNSWATGISLMDGTGNVGIGTTAAAAFKLQVAGDVGPNADLTYNLGSINNRWNNLYVNNIFGATLGVQGYWQRIAQAISPTSISDDVLIGNTATASALVRLPGTTNQDAFFNLGTGNFGIGTTTPLAKLDVRGAATVSGNLTLSNGSAVQPAYGPLTLNYKSGLNSWLPGITLQDTTGNVGINTTNPSLGKLQVGAGNIIVDTAYGLDLSAAGTLNLGNTTATTVNIGNTAATTIGIGAGGSLTRAISIGTGTGADTIHIGDGGTGADTITIGNTVAGTTTTLQGGTASTINFPAFQVAATTGKITSAAAVSDALNLTGNGSGITFGGSGANQIITASGNHLALMPGGTGNVGIDTTSPTQASFVVNGSSANLAQGSLLLYDTDNSNYSGFKANGTTTQNSVYTLPAAYAGGSGYILTGDASGNLGWSSPSALAIKWNYLQNPDNNLSLTMGTNTTGFNWATGTGANNLFSFTTDASANGTGYLVNVATGTSATVKPLRIAAGATEALMVDATGNVGIGQTSPTAKLDVSGTASVSGILTLGNNSALQSAYGPLTLNYKSGLNSWLAGITLQDTTGNTGIGTTLPSQGKLTVNGAIATLSQAALTLYDSDNSNYSGFKANGTTTQNSVYTLPAAYAGGSGYFLTGDTSGNMSWAAPSTLTVLWNNIQNPTGNLSLTMGTNTTAFNWATGTGASNLFSLTTDASANGTGYLLNVATGNSAAVKPFRFAAGSTEVMMADATGNVGIGITSPQVKLDVNGSASVSGNLTVGFNSALRSQFGPLNLAYKTGLDTWTYGVTLLDSSGNVGINSLTPQARLDVAGTASVSGILTLGNSSALQSGYGPLTLNYKSALNSWTAGITLQDTTGNVGIGTTLPNAFKLQLAGSIGPATTGAYDLGSAALAWRNVYANNVFGTTSGVQGYWQRSALQALAPTNITDDILTGATATASALVRLPGTNNQNAFFNLGTGNLGIGTTAPLAKLDVNGTASISGDLAIGFNSLIKSTYGPLSLAYKSGFNTWATGITLQDTTGFVGIGTTAPANRLQVSNSGFLPSGQALFALNQFENQDIFTASASGTPRFVIQNNGNVGIGTVTPNGALEVNGKLKVDDTLFINTDSVSHGGSNLVYNSAFTFGTDGWTNVTGTGVTSVQNENDAFTGGNVLRCAGGQCWYIGNQSIPFDPNVLYRVEAEVRQVSDPVSGGKNIYVGIAGRDQSDTSWVNISGANSTGSQHYFAASGTSVTQGQTWSRFVGYFKGRSGSPGGAHTDPYSPGTVHTNVYYIRPLVLVNYSAGNGIAEIGYVKITAIGQSLETLTAYGGATGLGGNVGIGTTNPLMQLDLYKASGSDSTLALRDADVNTGLTSVNGATVPATNTYGIFTSVDAQAGGLVITGMSDTTGTSFGTNYSGLTLQGVNGGASTTVPAINLIGYKTSAPNAIALGGDDVLFKLTNFGATQPTIQALGNGQVGIGIAPTYDASPITRYMLDINGNFRGKTFYGISDPSLQVTPNGTSRIYQLEINSPASPGPDNGLIAFYDPGNSRRVASMSANINNGVIILNNEIKASGGTDVCVGNPSLTIPGDNSSMQCDGKIDAGTIDPPYTINGKKYATYLTAMTGVKEETTGTVTIGTTDKVADGYATVIDFNNQPESSDLWLFSKTTSLKDHMNRMNVLLTPSDNVRAWYKVDPAKMALIIYSSRPATISYRLTAPRFDDETWANARPDDASGGFVLNDPDVVTAPYTLNASGSIFDEYQTVAGTTTDTSANALRTLSYQLRNIDSNQLYEDVALYSKALFGSITSGYLEAQNAVVTGVANIENLVAARLTAVTGQFTNLTASILHVDQKIVSPVVETTSLKVTDTADIAKLQTDTIAPKGSSLTVDLNTSTSSPSGSFANFVIKGIDDRAVASIDAQGNATFSGSLTAKALIGNELSAGAATVSGSLNAQDASISGTLVARNIQSDTIDTLNSSVASQSSSIENLATNINSIQQDLANIKNAPLPNPAYYQNLDSSTIATFSSVIAEKVQTDSLMATGTVNMYKASVAESFTAGNLLLQNNEILALSSELRLSALSQITLFDGSVVIARNGNITTTGEVVAQSGIRTNDIKPADPKKDINIDLTSENPVTGEKNTSINIVNEKGEVAASIDASGSARFNSIAFNQIATDSAIIADSGERTANNQIIPAMETNAAAAGTGLLPANAPEIIIYNANVKPNSLIYLTPLGDTGASQLTVIRKSADNQSYFAVSAGPVTHADIKFNWLIIN